MYKSLILENLLERIPIAIKKKIIFLIRINQGKIICLN